MWCTNEVAMDDVYEGRDSGNEAELLSIRSRKDEFFVGTSFAQGGDG